MHSSPPASCPLPTGLCANATNRGLDSHPAFQPTGRAGAERNSRLQARGVGARPQRSRLAVRRIPRFFATVTILPPLRSRGTLSCVPDAGLQGNHSQSRPLTRYFTLRPRFTRGLAAQAVKG
jgi:hypothetical protein